MEEVELFFEIEKHDSIEEFCLNFESIIKNNDNKEEIIKKLIILFKNEKQNLKVGYKEKLEEQQNVEIYEQIKRIKGIINYLKSIKSPEIMSKKNNDEVSKFKYKEIKTILPSQTSKTVIKKQKKTREKVILEEEFDILKLNLEQTKKYLNYFYKKKKNLINKKNEFQSTNNSSELEKIYKIIQKNNQIIDELIKHKDELIKHKENFECEQTIEEMPKLFRLPLSNTQIAQIDEHYHISTLPIIEKIQIDNFSDKQIDVLIQKYQVSLILELEKTRKLVADRKKVKKKNLNSDLSLYDEKIKKSNSYISALNNLINYLKHLKKNDKKESCNVKFQSEIKLSNTQISIEEQLINNEDIENCNLKDYLYSFGHFIKYQSLGEKTLKYAKEISSLCFEEGLDEETIQAIYYIWDAIKYSLNNTDKEDKNKRKTLKDIRIIFDFVIKNYQEKNNNLKHNYHFDLIDYFLNDEECYLYIEKLINISPDFVNIYHINSENESEHILIYILKKYIYNYQMMLNDKNSDYINKDYLLSVYFLYYHSKFLTLNKSEKEEIKSLINDFSKQVKKNITSSKRKYAVLNDLKTMNIDYQYYDVKNLKYLDEDRLNSSFNSIFLKFNNSIKSTKRRHISKNVIIGDNKYVAYSFSNKGKHVIKMHVLDLYDIVLKDTVLDSYLYNKTLEKEQLDSFLDSKFKMEIGKTYPTITYQITKYKDHIDFDIYQSKITPTKEGQLSFEEDINYQINNLIKQCFEEQKLPLIYTGINDDNETKFIEIMNNISHILNRFDKDEFNSIYQTLSQKIDNYHYSMKEIDGTYSFNIENPTIYPGLIIQRMIHELILENKNNPEENIKMINKYKEIMEQLVNDFNSFNHYVDSKELKETKGKLPKVIKRVNC